MAETYACPKCRAEAYEKELDAIGARIRTSAQEARDYALRVMRLIEGYMDIVRYDATHGTSSWSDEDVKAVIVMRDAIVARFTMLQEMRDQLDRISVRQRDLCTAFQSSS